MNTKKSDHQVYMANNNYVHRLGNHYSQRGTSYERAVEVEMYDDDEDIQSCLKRFDDTIDSLNVDHHYFANSIISNDPFSCMDPVRKLYLDKCNENISLRQENHVLKGRLGEYNENCPSARKPARARQELFDSMCFLE